MALQSVNEYGNINKDSLIEALQTLPEGKEIYDTEQIVYVVYPDYIFEIDLETGNIKDSETEKTDDTTPGELAGSGTEQKPYLIESIEDLVAFSNNVNNGNNYSGKYIKLVRNLDFELPNSYINPETTTFGDINGDGITEGLRKELTTGEGFTPIGNYNTDPIPFSGTFDGNKQYIKSLYINVKRDGEEFDAGLFGYISEGTVQDVYVLNCNINVDANHVCVGGIVGVQDDTVLRCVTSGKLVGKSTKSDTLNMIFVGGIAGKCSGEGVNTLIDRCYNLAEVSSINEIHGKYINSYAGGIVGEIVYKTQKTSNCYNKGKIFSQSSTVSTAGGIIAKIGGGSSRTITNSEIFNEILGGYIENCYNIGEISGKNKREGVEYNIGSAIGFVNGNTTINNVYGINNNEIAGTIIEEEEAPNVITKTETKTAEELKSDDILSKLGSEFKKDTGINNGYPILAWQ